jgi:hypothetical protein
MFLIFAVDTVMNNGDIHIPQEVEETSSPQLTVKFNKLNHNINHQLQKYIHPRRT